MTSSRIRNHRDYDLLLGEYNALKQKLDSKIEALQIISRELERLRHEKDHYKTMIDHLKPNRITERNSGEANIWDVNLCFDSRKSRGTCDLGRHASLESEVQDLRQRLNDADGDIKLLREQISRHRLDCNEDVSINRQFSPNERKCLIEQLESLQTKYMLLEKDLQTVLDEKEELITERDAYKHKVERLNHELNFALKGDEKKIIDIDSILMENRYLQERLRQTQEEKSLYLQTLSKYKNILEKRRNKSTLKFGSNGCSGVIITHKQVEQMLQNTNLSQLPTTQATVADLRSLALALFESLNDKNIALSHQKKANKILGHRLAELEKKIASDSPLNWTPSEYGDAVTTTLVTAGDKEGESCSPTDGVTDFSHAGVVVCHDSFSSNVVDSNVDVATIISNLQKLSTNEVVDGDSLLGASRDAMSCDNLNEADESDPAKGSAAVVTGLNNNMKSSHYPNSDYFINGSNCRTVQSLPDNNISAVDDDDCMPAALQKLVNDAMEAIDKDMASK